MLMDHADSEGDRVVQPVERVEEAVADVGTAQVRVVDLALVDLARIDVEDEVGRTEAAGADTRHRDPGTKAERVAGGRARDVDAGRRRHLVERQALAAEHRRLRVEHDLHRGRLAASQRQWRALIAITVLAVVVPFVLEWGGWVAPNYAFGPDGMLVKPVVMQLPEVPIRLLSLFVTLGALVGSVFYVRRVVLVEAELRRSWVLQNWHLRQMTMSPLAPRS